ncbi:hypothetical protein JCM17846_11540 [Iodidimonas nitroreducens]|uniref:Thioredoxin domain-containing protein n=1 Tax=Iodidimonas nitroreducens TaxID=1236968 RepID=A0A5A7N591_9PROT|nr:thioredoxin family protein [Iodidimonas nitroreducens]GAK33021.1 thioredoxin [alpha proteobacterium Q-1]GER03472.1 hypothetical protein JCM17846_11540 [Iodidimonas nitroreducens]
MRFFIKILSSIGLALVLGTGAAHAEWVDYSKEAFAQAQKDGRTQLVDISADWCPTCRAQKPILDELATEDRLGNVVFVKLDYDTHKDFLRTYNVPRQSTILIFDGATEVNRSIAETDRERLRSFVFESVDQITPSDRSDG